MGIMDNILKATVFTMLVIAVIMAITVYKVATTGGGNSPLVKVFVPEAEPSNKAEKVVFDTIHKNFTDVRTTKFGPNILAVKIRNPKPLVFDMHEDSMFPGLEWVRVVYKRGQIEFDDLMGVYQGLVILNKENGHGDGWIEKLKETWK